MPEENVQHINEIARTAKIIKLVPVYI